MSDINRIQGNFRGLVVQNKDNNILKMDQAGNFSLSTKTIENISYNKLINISENESIYTAKKNNLVLSSEEGTIIIRNGLENASKNYQFTNPSYSLENDTFFDATNTNQISHPFSSTEEVNNLRNDSFLIESVGNKSLCLYSNNGLNQVSHGNINIVGDSDILLQASQKLNLTSMGYILLNSERLMTAVEEDIHILSATGEFKVGGDGVSNIGLKVNSVSENNFVSLGRFNAKADRTLHIDIMDQGYDNSKKNGLLIESKSLTNNDTFPDIKLVNYNKTNLTNNNILETQLNIGIGSDSNDTNNLIFVKKQNIDGVTNLISLNNFKFTSTDVNKLVTYVDTTITADTIKSLVSDTQVILKTNITDTEVTTFNYQQGYINRDNHGHIKTKTNSDLHLGTNKNDIIAIKNTGNIGINNSNPQSTFDIQNNYGILNNIRINKNTIYQSAKAIQMNNSNYIVFYNTLSNNFYNLEASIYNINNDLVSTFIIYQNSYVFINFSANKLIDIEDKFVIAYSYFNNISYITESKVYNSEGVFGNINYKFTHDSLLETSIPQITSFSIITNQSTQQTYNGYFIVYRQKTGNHIEIKIDFLSNNSSNLVGSVEITNELNAYLASTIDIYQSTKTKNIKYHNIEYDSRNQKLLIACSGKFVIINTNSLEKTYYLSFIIEVSVTYNTVSLKPVLTISSNFKTLLNSETEEIIGFNIKLKNALQQLYIYTYYLSNLTNITKIVRGEYNSNSGIYLNPVTILDNLTDTISTSAERYYLVPQINILDTNNFIISYSHTQKISYYASSTNTTALLGSTDNVTTTLTNTNSPFIISLTDTNNIYLTTIIFFNNEDISNPYFYKTVNFEEILGVSNIFQIKNNNNNIQVKNSGDISITDIVEISKSNKTTQFEKLILKTSNTAITADTTGTHGELKIYENEIYVYLTNTWKKLNMTGI